MSGGNKRKSTTAGDTRVEEGEFQYSVASIKNLLVVKNTKSEAPPPRLLEILLTDNEGAKTFKAIEWKRVPEISEDTPVGTVLILDNPKFRGDSYLLEPETIREAVYPSGEVVTIVKPEPSPQKEEIKPQTNEAQPQAAKKTKVVDNTNPDQPVDQPAPRERERERVGVPGDPSFVEGGRPTPFDFIKEEWGEKTPKSYLMEWVQRFAKGQVPTWERVSIPNPNPPPDPIPEETPNSETPAAEITAEPTLEAGDGSISEPVTLGRAAAEGTEGQTDKTEPPKHLLHAVKVSFPAMLGLSPMVTDRFYPSMKEAEHSTSLVALAKVSEIPELIAVKHPEFIPPVDALPKRNKPKFDEPRNSRRYDNYSDSYRGSGRGGRRGGRRDGGGFGGGGGGGGGGGSGSGGGGGYTTVTAVPPAKYQSQSIYSPYANQMGVSPNNPTPSIPQTAPSTGIYSAYYMSTPQQTSYMPAPQQNSYISAPQQTSYMPAPQQTAQQSVTPTTATNPTGYYPYPTYPYTTYNYQ